MPEKPLDLEKLVSTYQPLQPDQQVAKLRDRGLLGQIIDPNFLYMPITDPSPWQGDVIPYAELFFTGTGGMPRRWGGPAILISPGCDTEPAQKPAALLAPVFSVADWFTNFEAEEPDTQLREERKLLLRRNRLLSFFYLPETAHTVDRFADLNFTSSVSSLHIQYLFQNADVTERTRLSDSGWYLFTAKLAHLVARQENQADFPRLDQPIA